MRSRFMPVLAYTGAGLTLLVAVCVPFVLMGFFTNLIAKAGLHIDESYSGGTVARTLDHGNYKVEIYRPVQPRPLQRVEPFIQVVFTPANNLPAYVDEQLDLDGNGEPEVRVSFNTGSATVAPSDGKITALRPEFISVSQFQPETFSRLLVRTRQGVVMRIPMYRVIAIR